MMISFLFTCFSFFLCYSSITAQNFDANLDENHRYFNANLTPNEKSEAFLEWSRGYLQTSTWPVDHGDSARSKYVFNAGFPSDIKAEDVKIQLNTDFKAIQWLYTGGKNSEWIYAMSGDSLSGFKVSKINGTTLEIVQQYVLQPSTYTGGLVIHRNGHVYAIHTNVLYRFWDGDLTNVTWIRLPTELNGHLTLTNGMLVAHDGSIVVKQWSFQLDDISLFLGSKAFLNNVRNGLIMISIVSIFFLLNRILFTKLSPSMKKITNGFLSLFFGYYIGNTIALILLLTTFSASLGPFNWVRYVTDSWISPNSGGGELKLIDPITLQVKAAAQLPERCSFARMALSTIKNQEDGVIEDAIVLLGDENVHQFRWRPSENSLYWIQPWSREYRRKRDGSFPGTGPSIYNGMTYFTDNTFPVASLGDNTYRFYAASIHHIPPTIPHLKENKKNVDFTKEGRLITKKDYIHAKDISAFPSNHLKHFTQNNYYPLLPYDHILPPKPKQQAGFMFWSTAINPPRDHHEGSVIVWDSSRSVVQGRNLKNPTEILWQLDDVTQADCVTIIPDRNHIYLTDYGRTPKHVSKWLSAVSGDVPEFSTNDKYFLIADTRNGQVIVNITLPGLGTSPTLIVPGKNNDVFLGAQRGLVRIYTEK